MSATIVDYINKCGSLHYPANSIPNSYKSKLNIIGTHFSSLACFKKASIEEINDLKTVEGNICFKPLNETRGCTYGCTSKFVFHSRSPKIIKILLHLFNF